MDAKEYVRRSIWYIVGAFVLGVIFFAAIQADQADATTVTPIFGGGTGTSTAPTYGKVLVGDSNGNYELIATSSLGFPVGGSGTVTSVQLGTPNSSLTITGTNPVTTSGTINADINTAHANTWTSLQWFTQNASTSQLTATSTVWLTNSTSALLKTDANGLVGTYGGTSCTNQALTALSALGAATCTSVTDSFFSGQLSVAHGGTGASNIGKLQLLATDSSGNVISSSTPTAAAFFASSTSLASQLPYASTTMITATTASSTNLTVSGVRSALHVADSNGNVSAYGGSNPCSNQVALSISATGVISCTSLTSAMVSGQWTTAVGGTNHGNYTAGSVVFAGSNGTSITEDNANLFWDDTLNGLGVSTSSPRWALEIASSTRPQLDLYDGAHHWSFYGGGGFYLSTSSLTNFGTSSAPVLIIDSNGLPTFPSLAASAGNNCLQVDTTGKISKTGSACGSGSGSAFPFTPAANYNATSTTLGLLNGLFSTASSTFNNNVFFPNRTVPNVAYFGTNGLLQDVATGTISNGTNISVTNGSSASVLGSGITINISGTIGISNGGTNNNSGGTTNGVEYYDGSKLTNDSVFLHQPSAAVSIGSSTPWGQLSVATTTASSPLTALLAIASSSNSTLFQVNGAGAIGVFATTSQATSTSMTYDWSRSPSLVEYQMGTSAYTVTFVNATTSLWYGSRKTIGFCNPGSTGGAITLKGVENASGYTQTTTANQCDYVGFMVVAATSTNVSGAQSYKLIVTGTQTGIQ